MACVLMVCIVMALSPGAASAAGPRLIVGNTESGGIGTFDAESGAYLGEFLSPTDDGSAIPDDLTPDRHGRLLVSLGAERPRPGNGVALFALPEGSPIPIRWTAPSLVRPYGVATACSSPRSEATRSSRSTSHIRNAVRAGSLPAPVPATG